MSLRRHAIPTPVPEPWARVEIVSAWGRQTLISIDTRESAGYTISMEGAAHGGGTDAAVAGRIGAHEPHRLRDGIERWGSWLSSLDKRDRTIDAYRRTVKAWSVHGPHEWVHDLSYDNISAYMAWKRSNGDWGGKTYNHALSAFRSLTGYMARIGWLARDPMIDADRAKADDAPGARAATMAEVRALLEQALMRQGDGRAKGFRAGYWACLAMAGARYSEPGRWLWGDLDLEAEIPTIRWRPEAQKIAKRVTLALHPALAAVLRSYRPYCPGSDDPAAPVFPVKATRPAFKDDAVRAGIDPEGFSPHSLRKFFETTLINAHVPARLVDLLMRHSLGAPGAYYRPTIEAQAFALSKMPNVLSQKIARSEPPTLEMAAGNPTLGIVTPMMNTHVQTADDPAASANIGVTSDLAGCGVVSALHEGSGGILQSDPLIGVVGLLKRADPTAAADFLRAFARLLDGR